MSETQEPTEPDPKNPIVLCADPFGDRAGWLAARKGKIGASQLGAVLGMSLHVSPIEVWATITGREKLDDNDALKRGRFMEPGIAAWWEEETRLELELTPGLLQHPTIPWLVATPDFLYRSLGQIGVLEVKKRDFSTRELWTPEPPVEIQLQHDATMFCVGAEIGQIACDFGRGPLHIVRRVRNDLLLEQALDIANDWWHAYVQKDVPPPLTGHEGATRIWKALHPKDNGARVVADETVALAAQRYDEAHAAVTRAEKDKDAAKAAIMQAIGDATFVVLPDGSGFSWKHQVTEYDPQPARTVETRVLRRVKKV